MQPARGSLLFGEGRGGWSGAHACPPLSEGTPGPLTVPVGCGWVADDAAICRDLPTRESHVRRNLARRIYRSKFNVPLGVEARFCVIR